MACARLTALLAAVLPSALAQQMYGRHKTFEEHVAPTYAGERCVYYDVRRLSWRGVARLPWPRRRTVVVARSLRIPACPPPPSAAPRTVAGAPLTQAHFWRGGMCGLS